MPSDAVLRLERDVDPLGDVVRHQRRNADAEVDVPAVFQFLGGPRRHLVPVPSHQTASRLRTVRCSMRFLCGPAMMRCT